MGAACATELTPAVDPSDQCPSSQCRAAYCAVSPLASLRTPIPLFEAATVASRSEKIGSGASPTVRPKLRPDVFVSVASKPATPRLASPSTPSRCRVPPAEEPTTPKSQGSPSRSSTSARVTFRSHAFVLQDSQNGWMEESRNGSFVETSCRGGAAVSIASNAEEEEEFFLSLCSPTVHVEGEEYTFELAANTSLLPVQVHSDRCYKQQIARRKPTLKATETNNTE